MIIYDLISVDHNNLCYLRSIKNFFLIISFLITTNLFSQTISKIEITGYKNFSQNEYLSWIKIPIGTKYFTGLEDSIKTRVGSVLRGKGYFHSSCNVQTEKVDSAKSKVEVAITEGTPTHINEIHFAKPFKDSVTISNILLQLKTSLFNSANIESVLGEILDFYENNGYPFANVKIESVEFADDSTKENHLANLHLLVDEGTKSTIDKIEITGNTKTKDYVIIRALQMQAGEKYSQNIIDVIPEKLNRLRFFDTVEQPTFYFNSKQQGVLRINIKEKETNYFDGIAGYVPAANDKESGFFTGFVNVNMRNLFGTGRAVAFRWQQENRSSQELELHYLEPWLFGFPFNFEGNIFQRKQDSTYVQRNLEGRLEFLATHEISASVIVNTESTIPTELASGVFTVYNSSAFTSGVNLKIDSRDDFYSPTSGLLFNSAYKFTSKKINGPVQFITAGTNTRTNLQRIEFDFVIFKQFFNRQIAAFGIHGRELRGSNTEFSDLYFLGGTNSLRGYKERQFQGNRILWSNLEYRLLLSRRSFAFLFFDSGYFLRNEDVVKNIAESSSFKTGYGFGLNIETGLGVLGISFALGKGDSFSQGKIHFGIINEF